MSHFCASTCVRNRGATNKNVLSKAYNATRAAGHAPPPECSSSVRERSMKPNMRPARPDFSSGPCAKRPGWTPEVLMDAAVGRSHRSKLGKKKIVETVDRTRRVLGIPADYKVAIVPASDTGAVEMALWSLLGARPVDM